MVDQIVTTYKVAGKPVNTWVSGIMSGIKRNEFSEYRIPDRKQSYLWSALKLHFSGQESKNQKPEYHGRSLPDPAF